MAAMAASVVSSLSSRRRRWVNRAYAASAASEPATSDFSRLVGPCSASAGADRTISDGVGGSEGTGAGVRGRSDDGRSGFNQLTIDPLSLQVSAA